MPLLMITNAATLTAYKAICTISAILCIIEGVRVIMMMRKMHQHKIADKEPIIYGCLLATTIILATLACRSLYDAYRIHAQTPMCWRVTLNIIPLLLYVYTLRVGGRYLWAQMVQYKYSIDINKHKEN